MRVTSRSRGAHAVPALIAAVLLGPLALSAPAHADSGQAYVEGRVTDDAGRPFGGMSVALSTCRPAVHAKPKRFGCTGAHSTKHYGNVSATTGPDGHYVIEVPKTRVHSGRGWRYYVIADDDSVRRPDHPRAGYHTVLAASERLKAPRTGHDVKVPAFAVPASALDAAWTGPMTPPTPTPPAPGAQPAILGTVSAAAGGPIARFVADEVVPGGSLPSTRLRWNQYAGYRSTPDQSTYHLAVYADGYEPFDVQVPLSDAGPATRDVRLTAEPIVTGRLVVPHPRHGWWAQVNVSDASGQHVAAVGTDAKGRFRAVLDDRLGAGPYSTSAKVVYLHPRSKMVWRSSTAMAFAPGTTTDVGKLRVHKP